MYWTGHLQPSFIFEKRFRDRYDIMKMRMSHEWRTAARLSPTCNRGSRQVIRIRAVGIWPGAIPASFHDGSPVL